MEQSMSKPLVSVVMAAYNAAQYIGPAIESVLSQTYENIELIVVDDGSTDQTLVEIENYKFDSRLRIINQNNSGQTVAKNRGIEASQGSYIAFCDADDLWHNEKLRIQLRKFSEDELIAVVYSDTFLIDELGKNLGSEDKVPFYEGYLLKKLIFDNFIPFGTVLVKRSCIKEFGGFNENYKMGIDWDLWLRISTKWKISFVKEKLYFYRQWQGQMSRNYHGRYQGALLILREFRRCYPNSVTGREYRDAISDIYANYAYHVSLYEGYSKTLIFFIGKSLIFSPFRLATHKRVLRALLRRF